MTASQIIRQQLGRGAGGGVGERKKVKPGNDSLGAWSLKGREGVCYHHWCMLCIKMLWQLCSVCHAYWVPLALVASMAFPYSSTTQEWRWWHMCSPPPSLPWFSVLAPFCYRARRETVIGMDQKSKELWRHFQIEPNSGVFFVAVWNQSGWKSETSYKKLLFKYI